MHVIAIEVGEHAGYLIDLLSAQSELLSALSIHAQWRSSGTLVRVEWMDDRCIRLKKITRWIPQSATLATDDRSPAETLEGDCKSLLRLCLSAALARVIRERVAVDYMASVIESIGSPLMPEERAAVLDEAVRQAFAAEVCEEYSLYDEEEHGTDVWACLDYSDRGVVSGSIKVDQVFIKLYEYLSTSDELSVEGFLRFRLRGYLERLRNAVYRAVDRFLLDQQRKEFVELLRYFAEVQHPRTESVTVVRNVDGRLRFHDASGGLMDTDGLLEDLDDLADYDFGAEDILIGLLIAVAPARVLICMRGGSLLFENTINVFRGRVLVCDGCSCCRLFEGAGPPGRGTVR